MPTRSTWKEWTSKLIEHSAVREQNSLQESESALEVVRELDGLPLAIDQARAYIDIERGRCSVTEYLQLYRTRRKALLQKRGSPHSGHPESVVTTFTLSFERVQQDNPIAATLLRFCACLHPDSIPQELITANLSIGDSTSQQLIPDPTIGHDAVDDLLKYSLVRQLADDHTLTMHRLVQAVMHDAMEEEEQKQWAKQAVGAIYHALQGLGLDAMQEYGRYFLNAELCAEFIRHWRFHFPEALHLLIELSRYLRIRASYDQAERYGLQAADLLEEIPSPEPIDRILVFANLGNIYQAKELHKSAGPYYEQAVDILENELPGVDDALLAICQSNLAKSYMKRGRLKGAEPLAQRALALIERVRGPEHPEVAYCLSVLATIYRDQERYRDAEPLYRRALAICERADGPQSYEVAESLNNLATILVVLGKHEEAEQLNRRALAIYRQVQGPEHPDVARCLTCLSDFYAYKQDWLEAKRLNQWALAIYEKTAVDEHPRLFEPLFNLAAIAEQEGHYEEAQTWYQRALDIVEKYPHISAGWLAALGSAEVLERLHKPAEATQMRALARKLWSQNN
jgi:tetratricopeptide (TPR) repeat protein